MLDFESTRHLLSKLVNLNVDVSGLVIIRAVLLVHVLLRQYEKSWVVGEWPASYKLIHSIERKL